MKSQELDDFHERDDEESDKSSSESTNNNPLLISEITRKTEKKIQQKFMELSSFVPGLKKTDEISMLEDAINYVKQLQERANILEGQKMKQNVVVQKAWVSGNNDIATSSSNFPESCYQSKQALPEIEIKARGQDLLIRVICENQKGYIAKVVGEIEKLHLNVENINSLPFGNYLLAITVSAQMGVEFFMTTEDLKHNLQQALQL